MQVETLQELLSLDDVPFIRAAYQTLLAREADHGGLNFYSHRLRAGVSKIIILGELRASAEGRSQNTDIPGLDDTIRRAHSARKPVIGHFVRWVCSVEGDTPVECALRVLSNDIARLRQEVADLREANHGLQHAVSSCLAADAALNSGSVAQSQETPDHPATSRSSSRRGAVPGVMERFFAQTGWKVE
ncbi:DUF4214 domain-containing protein [Sphingomonas sp. PWP1-2]|uniref:DUF4214 domain-containing protein n=1 Tax=Sphingomonas sp. PWP1-2 TaxID=2804558 RepID=UPI003CECE374